MLPQLDLSHYLSSVVWLIISFGSFFLFVNFWLVPRLNSISKKRKVYIDKHMQQIDEMRNEIAKIEQQNEEKLMLAQEEAERIKAEALNEFTREANAIIDSANKECANLLAKEMSIIEKNVNSLLAKKEQIAETVAISILDRIKTD
ncbi:ATP synthase F0 subunit B [Candidatus Sneabacter namystus]|uniref:ATP synthase F0 subunit B n=1 Tax=Candidatus Sneabacter namystus TaxID=2601646 RepID=A0A5C0UJI0_9RICK|nr:ATP synthase F0 subunit B [Candidatus Sneabacter namystus]QEK39673.1 ATP synthase F0 subunit B [Candidatus Sneabacter namystus]